MALLRSRPNRAAEIGAALWRMMDGSRAHRACARQADKADLRRATRPGDIVRVGAAQPALCQLLRGRGIRSALPPLRRQR